MRPGRQSRERGRTLALVRDVKVKLGLDVFFSFLGHVGGDERRVKRNEARVQLEYCANLLPLWLVRVQRGWCCGLASLSRDAVGVLLSTQEASLGLAELCICFVSSSS